MSEKLLARASREAKRRKAIESQPVLRDVQPEVTDEWLPFIGVTPHTITHVGGVLREQALLHLQHTVGNHVVQRTVDRSRSTSVSTDDLAQRIRAASISGNPLDAAVRDRLEVGLDADLSSVQIHTDDEADRLSRSVHALAFTTGQHIFFRQGEYQPDTVEGLHLIAHEATHTVQQLSAPLIDQISISEPSDELELDASHAADRIAERTRRSTSQASIGAWDRVSIQRQTLAEEERLKYQTVTQQEPPGISNIGTLPGEKEKWREVPLFGQGGLSAVGGISDEELRLRLGYQRGGWNIGGSITTGGDVNVQAGGPVFGPFGGANISAGTSGVDLSGYATLPLPGSPTIGGGAGSSGAWLGGSISPTDWLTLTAMLGHSPEQGGWGGVGARFTF